PGLPRDHREPWAERQDGVVDHAQTPKAQLLEHRYISGSSGGGDASRRLRTGSWNFDTSRSAKLVVPSRTTLIGGAPRRIRTRPPAGTRRDRRPSQLSIASCPRLTRSTSTTDVGATTIGRVNRACAAFGTISSASTSGHMIGPPAENA